MTDEKLSALREAQMQILDELDRVCRENSLKYYLIGGTALGALRHGGYIPWDIDIDIDMPREDYDRFLEISQKELSPNFFTKNYKNTKNHYSAHALVCMKNTSVKMDTDALNPPEKTREIYIDIFPLDKAPEDVKLQKKQDRCLRILGELKLRKRGYLYRGTAIEKIAKAAVKLVLSPVSMYRLSVWQDKTMRKYSKGNSNLVCSMASKYAYGVHVMPMAYYGRPTPIKFENRVYFAPEKLHEFLSKIYGDYMTLPPENERNAWLSCVVDVDFNVKS